MSNTSDDNKIKREKQVDKLILSKFYEKEVSLTPLERFTMMALTQTPNHDDEEMTVEQGLENILKKLDKQHKKQKVIDQIKY